jgi:PAS domain S-box-containing protein
MNLRINPLVMDKKHYEDIIRKAPFAYAHHELILDEKGNPSDYRFLEVNRAFEELTGLEAGQVTGKTVMEVLPGIRESAFDWVAFYGRLVLEGCSERFEQYSEPLKRWYEVHAFPTEDNCFTVIFLDVSAFKKLEKKTTRSREKYHRIFEHSPLGILHFNNHGIILDCNDSFVDIIGSSREAIVGLNLKQLPDQQIVRAVKNTLEGKVSRHEGIYQSVTASKATPVRGAFAPIFSIDGQVDGGIGIIEDITEHLRIQQELEHQLQFQKLVTHISSDFVAAGTENLDEKIHDMLARAGAFFKVDRAYVFLFSGHGKHMSNTHEWCAPDTGSQMESIRDVPVDSLPWWRDRMLRNETVHIPDVGALPAEAAAEREEFRRQDIRSLLTVPMFSGEHPLGFFGFDAVHQQRSWNEEEISFLKVLANILTDAIRKAEGEKAMRRAREKAEESDRLKSVFLANISHEIRTPMNGIMGFLELIRQPELDGDKKDHYIELVTKSGHRLMDTINDIVELSKIESGQMQTHWAETDLGELMDFHAGFFTPLAEEKGLELIRSDRIREGEAVVLADRQKLDGILTNLLYNAVKFTETGVIELGSYRDGDKLVFCVSDTGRGIPSERQEAIFQRFVQADLEESRPHEGAGLGLSIARAYANMLGGSLWVESEAGKGSSFYFSMPYKPSSRPAMAGERPAARLRTPGEARTLLVAEDDEMSYQFMELILEEEGYQLLHAANGEEAVHLLRDNPDIDLVLMDIKMPVMTGLEATRKIREFNPDIPVIAQTAYAMSGDRERILEAGCTDYITKPISRDLLIHKLNKYLKATGA